MPPTSGPIKGGQGTGEERSGSSSLPSAMALGQWWEGAPGWGPRKMHTWGLGSQLPRCPHQRPMSRGRAVGLQDISSLAQGHGQLAAMGGRPSLWKLPLSLARALHYYYITPHGDLNTTGSTLQAPTGPSASPAQALTHLSCTDPCARHY